jgi:glycerol-3-phosphate acyltransferase PlsY
MRKPPVEDPGRSLVLAAVALWPFLVVASYLVGTLPTAQAVCRRSGVDPTIAGSGNPGASNVVRVAGWRAGALVLAGDLAKGALPALAGLIAGGRWLALACGVAAVAGHVVPATRQFRGGKGVATGGGVALVLFPVPAVCVAAIWIAVSRWAPASVASLVAAAALPAVLLVAGFPAVELLAASAIGAVILVRHRTNVARLRDGTEPLLRDRRA